MTEDELYQRKIALNKCFEWSKKNIQRILTFNDVIFQKYHEAYEKVLQVKNDLENLSKAGCSIYDDYRIECEVLFCPSEENYGCDYEIFETLENYPANSGNTIVIAKDKNSDKYSIPLENQEKYFLQDLNWNIGIFNRPEFENIKIAYFLHSFFHDGNYALEDLLKMNPGDIKIFITVELAE